MRRILLLVLLLLGCTVSVQGQSTTVSGTVTDAGAQTWNNGTYTFQLVANPNFPNLAQYTWTGGTLNQVISGTLNGSGAYSQSVPSNTAISPQGSKWQLTVCPKATFSCFAAPNTTITGATQTLNVTPPVIAISLINPINTLAYSDSEIVSAIVGSMYYNLTTQQERICQAVVIQSCTTWVNIGAGASAAVTSISATSPIVATPNPITGVGNISCPTCATGTTTPGGANTNVQYNDSGAFGGDANFIWNKTTRSIRTLGGASTDSVISAGASTFNAFEVTATNTSMFANETGATNEIRSNGGNHFDPGTGKNNFGTAGGISGEANFVGLTSGSAEVGVADVAGTPNRINWPTATGTSGQVLTTNGANPQQTSWTTVTASVTAGNCSSSASPAVCGSSSAGSVAVPAGSTSVVVNTTAVTANSQILLQYDSSLGTKLSVTCNTIAAVPAVTARTAATSFTLTIPAAPVTNPACYSYFMVN